MSGEQQPDLGEKPALDAAVIKPDLAARLRETFTPEERVGLIAALLAEQAADKQAADRQAAIERINNANFVVNADPVMKGTLEDPPPDGAPEAVDTPEERARLLAILAQHISGISPYTLLDVHHIPPSTLEFASRDGQMTKAERGVGLTRAYGGAW